jgi:hypothetical protein
MIIGSDVLVNLTTSSSGGKILISGICQRLTVIMAFFKDVCVLIPET